MANKKMKAPEPVTEELHHMQPETRALVASDAAIASTHIDAIERLYGDGLEFNEARSVARYQAHKSAGTRLMLLAGAELIRIKEHTERGHFLFLLQTELDTEPRAAQKMMQAAAKFLTADGSPRPLLGRNDVGSTKLFELMLLDDEDLDAIEQGERVAGINKDDIANMSVSELRAAVRVAREKEAADQRLLDQVYESKTKVERENDKLKRGGKDVTETLYREELNTSRNVLDDVLGGSERLMASIGVALTELDQTDVPASADGIEKRNIVMNAVNRLDQLAETLARLQQGAHNTFATYIDDARALLITAEGSE